MSKAIPQEDIDLLIEYIGDLVLRDLVNLTRKDINERPNEDPLLNAYVDCCRLIKRSGLGTDYVDYVMDDSAENMGNMIIKLAHTDYGLDQWVLPEVEKVPLAGLCLPDGGAA